MTIILSSKGQTIITATGLHWLTILTNHVPRRQMILKVQKIFYIKGKWGSSKQKSKLLRINRIFSTKMKNIHMKTAYKMSQSHYQALLNSQIILINFSNRNQIAIHMMILKQTPTKYQSRTNLYSKTILIKWWVQHWKILMKQETNWSLIVLLLKKKKKALRGFSIYKFNSMKPMIPILNHFRRISDFRRNWLPTSIKTKRLH